MFTKKERKNTSIVQYTPINNSLIVYIPPVKQYNGEYTQTCK